MLYEVITDTFNLEALDAAAVGVVTLRGQGGDDTLVGPAADTTWVVDGADSGEVAGVRFAAIENLRGQSDNQDYFIVTATGSLTGVLDGGEGGFDSMELSGGTYDSVSYVAFDAHSGTVERDGNLLTYAGLEPINDNSDTDNRVIRNNFV